MIKINWEAIASDDFKAIHGAYMLRAEQMDKKAWWFQTYHNDDELAIETFAPTEEMAKAMAELTMYRHIDSRSQLSEAKVYVECDYDDATYVAKKRQGGYLVHDIRLRKTTLRAAIRKLTPVQAEVSEGVVFDVPCDCNDEHKQWKVKRLLSLVCANCGSIRPAKSHPTPKDAHTTEQIIDDVWVKNCDSGNPNDDEPLEWMFKHHFKAALKELGLKTK